jgi:hypothetical protein
VSGCILPFDKVASYDWNREIKVLINEDIRIWLSEHQGSYVWLINSVSNIESWQVSFEFVNHSDLVLFKLTFG